MAKSTEAQRKIWTRVIKLAESHNKDWTFIADALNNEGVSTSQGKSFTRQNVEVIYRRYKSRIPREEDQAIPLFGDNPPLKHVSDSAVDSIIPEQPPVVTSVLTVESELLERIMKSVQWFEENVEQGGYDPRRFRPRFAGTVRSLGLKIREPVYEAAMQRARTERHIVGKSFNALVEFLLWQYARAPEELVDTSEDTE